MKDIVLYRKRLIPNECVKLKDDIILFADDERIITKWNTLKPKKDLHHGYSCYFLNKGFKISKFFKEDGSLLYWYCDIVSFENNSDGEIIVTDLLADVIIYPDGFVKVVDIDELVESLDKKLIDDNQLKTALIELNDLLSIIYAGDFEKLTRFIEVYE